MYNDEIHHIDVHVELKTGKDFHIKVESTAEEAPSLKATLKELTKQLLVGELPVIKILDFENRAYYIKGEETAMIVVD